jgi:predicted Zn-dependent peptidase
MKKTLRTLFWILLGLGSALARQERFRKSPPIPEPLLRPELPKIEATRLQNGLLVAVVPRPDQPFISLELVILAGESRSPRRLPGLASFTAEMLSRGTPLVSAADLEERIDAIGGDFSTTTTPDFSRFSFHFLPGFLDQALEVLSLMVRQPDFSNREVVALIRTKFYDLKQKQRDPEFVGRRQLLRVLFNDHPYLQFFYSEDVIKNLTRKDIQGFYESYYRPNNALIVLAGNLDLSIAARRVSHFLNLWPMKDIAEPLLPSPQANTVDRFCFVDLPQAKEATLVLGNLISPLAEPDYYPLGVLNQVLGGTPFSRLFMNLREAKEYAYSAFSQVGFFQACGYYAVTAQVIPPASGPSIREIKRELERISREKVSNFELEQAKSYLIGQFPIRIARLDELSRQVSELLAFSVVDSRWSRFLENITQVDADRIFEVAQKYLLPKPVVVIVGDKDVLLDQLRELDRLEVYDLKGVLLYTLIKGVEG